MKTLLWLDDYRDPRKDDWGKVFSPIGSTNNIIWVKSYEEFTQYINNNSLPDGICFDHDLGEEKTGYDCAKWLVNYCMNNNLQLPVYAIQSANPVGKENIDKLLTNFNNRIINNK